MWALLNPRFHGISATPEGSWRIPRMLYILSTSPALSAGSGSISMRRSVSGVIVRPWHGAYSRTVI